MFPAFFFSIYAENTIFKKEKRNQANKNTNEFWKQQTRIQTDPSIPTSMSFQFQKCLYVWFFICKEDLWGQIVQIFYFSHHWTNKTTDSHFINMLEKEHSLFYSFCFYRVGFSFSFQWNTKIMFLYRITYTSMQAHKFDCSVKETLYMLCLVAQACLTLWPHGL